MITTELGDGALTAVKSMEKLNFGVLNTNDFLYFLYIINVKKFIKQRNGDKNQSHL